MEETVSPSQVRQIKPGQKSSSKKVVVVSLIGLSFLILVGGATAAYFVYKEVGKNETASQQSEQEEIEQYETTESGKTPDVYDIGSKIVTEYENFEIVEEFISEQTNFETITDRLEITTSGSYDCTWETDPNNYNISVCTSDDGAYELRSENFSTYTLTKNDELIWEREITPGPCNGVTGFKIVGDEIAIDYINIGPETNSVVLSKDQTLLDVLDSNSYDSAFAPFSIADKPLYIAEQNDKQFLVYDSKEIGPKYDEIYYACCCSGLVDSVRGDGNIIDFFARKEDDWYYVKAGDPSYL